MPEPSKIHPIFLKILADYFPNIAKEEANK